MKRLLRNAVANPYSSTLSYSFAMIRLGGFYSFGVNSRSSRRIFRTSIDAASLRLVRTRKRG